MIRMRTLFRLYIFSIMFICASVSVMAQSKIYYVSPNGTGDGSSWKSTMKLADALNTAKAGDQIWVQGFESVDDAKSLYEGSFTLKSGVQLYGGFAGTEKNIDERVTLGKPYQMKYRSVLSGDLKNDDKVDNTNLIFPANGTRSDNATHVLSVKMDPLSGSNNNTYPTVINGFTITGGHADGTSEKGGGIYISGDNTGGGNFRIERCFLFNNYATQGGAVYVSSEVLNPNNGESLINQCVVYNNAAGERSAVENQGGGIYLAGAATVVNTSVFNNVNGGLRISSGSKVVNSTIARNTGAGVDMTETPSGTNTNVYNSIIWGNTFLSVENQPGFKNSAFHEVTVTDADAGTDDNGNVYVAKENRDEAAGPMFDAPSVKTSYDRDFNWRQTAYPLGSWNVLEGSVMIDKGNDAHQQDVYGTEDMAGNTRVSGGAIDIGAYEYQYLPESRIRYVKPTATGTGDGSSWDNASGNIQNMIDELANNANGQAGEVWVAAGIYTPQSQLISGTAYSASFRMRDGISVYGGFNADKPESSKLDRAKGTMPWDFTNETILQAAYYDHNDFSWTNNKWTLTSDSRHVVWFAPMPGESAFTNVTTLDGVTIQGGYAQGGTGLDDFKTDRGGGVYMDGANAYLSNCIVKENYATGNGGGVYLKNGRVQTSLIYNNNADADGGAVYVENRGLVHRSMLANNSALNGAGVYLHNVTEMSEDHPEYLILSTCVVSNNTVRGNGAVYCDKGGVLMQNTITNNNCVTATDATDTNASQTGGIYVDEYALVVNSVLWNNKMNGGTNIPMYARNPSADKVKFLYNAISGVNNAVWNNTLQQQTLSLVDENAGKQDDGNSIGPRFTEPTTDMNFDLESNYGVQSGWKDGIISYYWKPVDGSNLWARGMALGQLPNDVVLSPELDIEGNIYAQKPAVGAFMVKATDIEPEKTDDALTVYVDVDCTEPEHQGNSWATAYRSLNNAISYLASLDAGTVGNKQLVVRVLEGNLWPRYAFTNNDPKTATITVPATQSGQPIEIYGGYHRTTDNNTVVRDPLTYRSIINGNTEGKDITQGLYHCITVEQGAKLVLDGFHVINGYAAGEASRQYGAGLLAHAGSTVTVRNCIFENNTAQEGAAIDAREATLTMENCVVNNNTNTENTSPVVNGDLNNTTMHHVTIVNNIGAAVVDESILSGSSFSKGNTSKNSIDTKLATTGAEGAKNFTNPTNAAGATLGFDTYLGGYSSFRPLTSSIASADLIINKVVNPIDSLSNDIMNNERNLGGVPDLGAYEADLPKAGKVIYVRSYNTVWDNRGEESDGKPNLSIATAGDGSSWENAINGNAICDLEQPWSGTEAGFYINDKGKLIQSSRDDAQYSDNGTYGPSAGCYGSFWTGGNTKNGYGNSGYLHYTIKNNRYERYVSGLQYAVEKAAEINKSLGADEEPVEVWVGAGIYTDYKGFVIRDKVKVLGGFPATGVPGENDRIPLLSDYVPASDEYASLSKSNYETILQIRRETPVTFKNNNEASVTDVISSLSSTTRKYVLFQPDVCLPTWDISGDGGTGGNVYRYDKNSSNYDKNYVDYEGATWDGFTVRHGYIKSYYSNRDGGAGIRCFRGVTLQNIVITHNCNYHNDRNRGGGLYMDGENSRINNSFILNNYLGYAGQSMGGGAYMIVGTGYNLVVANNHCSYSGGGLFMERASFFNNTVAYNRANSLGSGLSQWSGSTGSTKLELYNCIFYGNEGSNVLYSNAINTFQPAYNCYVNGKVDNNLVVKFSETNGNRIGSDLENPFGNSNPQTSNNFRLKAGNYCVNNGTLLAGDVKINLPSTDMDYTNRIKDCTVDIGAYERDNEDTTFPDSGGNFYVTWTGFGNASANSPQNAACAEKLQIVLNAAGKLAAQGTSATVKIAGYKADADFVYHANTLSDKNNPQSYTFVVPEGVTVIGGYYEGSFKNGVYQDDGWTEDERNSLTYRTILSAEAIPTQGSTLTQNVTGFHTVTFGGGDGTAALTKSTIIDGVWLTDGSATSMAGAGKPNTRGGGAIVPSGAHVRNCVVMDCEAIEGGGLYLMPGATVSGTLVMNNSAENGGGVYADNTDVSADSRAHILSCTIANNEASSTGGGLYMEDGAVMNVNTVVFGNKAGSDKNVSGVVNLQFEDSKLASVFNIDGQTRFYPFNSSFVETQEMPSDFENRMLESDKSLYFADDYYRLKDYSLLIKHGLKNEYQSGKTDDEGNIISKGLVATFNVAESDMQNIARVQTGNGAYRLDAGAFAYEGGILPDDLFTRIFVSQTANVTLPDGEDMNKYLGRSFYTSFSTLEDALGYIRSMRKDEKNADTKFEILVAGGTYKPSNERTTTAEVAHDQRLCSFEVPQGVSIYGGFSGTEKYSSSSSTDMNGFTDIGTEVTGLNVDGDIEDILKARAYSDFNQNNILEPWELANQTILSGQINVSSTAQNAYHVVFTDKGTATTVDPVVLDGLTVMYGQTDNKLSIITDNNEQGRGGGIYSNGVTYTISRCRLLNNTAVRGGAVFVRNADLNLSGCILAGNKTVYNDAKVTTYNLTSRGGAAYVSGISKEVNLRAVNTLWANNESAEEGGAIGTNYAEGISSQHDPLLYIMNNTFVRNKAATNPVIYTHNGKSSIVNTLLWGNQGDTYQSPTNLSTIYDVSYCASDVDYVYKFTSGNSNNNILLSTDNMGDNGPRFTNPSTVAGVDGNSASSLWNPAAISVVTDAGDGTEHNDDESNTSETDHKAGETTGAYQDWFDANSTTTGYLGKNGVTEAYVTNATGTYSRYSGPRGQNNEELCKPIDIGLYEYQYVSDFSTMEYIYVDTLSRGTGSGNSWANATDDLRGAIVGAANPTDNVDKPRVVYIRDGNYSWNRTSAGSAYILNMQETNNISLTLKGSCTGSGDQQDFSKPTILRNEGSTTNLISVSANSKPVTFEGFTFINDTEDTGIGMNASAGSGGSLTLKNCGFRISPTGLNISGNSGNVLIYNTLFADGGTGLNVESTSSSNITLVNTTFANNSTADMSNGLTNVYNSVSWNNKTQKMPLIGGLYNKVFSFTGDAAENNADIQNGPNFVDPLNDNKESRDYHIRPSVQLLNKGSNQNYIDHVVNVVSDADATEVDLGNNARLVDNSIDIGAYEYEAPLQPIVYVKPDLTGAADGKSWETALGDLQGAVDLAGLYALNHKNATGYVFVHGKYNDKGLLNLSLGNTKVYGGMNDERSDVELAADFKNTADVVNSLLGKRKGMLENTNRSSLNNVTISADGSIVDGFVVNGTATVNDGALSTSVVNNDVSGKTDGLLYNSLVLGDGTADHPGNVSGVKAVNVTATGTITGADGSGNNRVSVTETNTYVTDDYWKYQLMETATDDDIDMGANDKTQPCIDMVGHSRDLIGNKRIRNTVDNGCFETWNIISDAQITADDKPVGKSVVYVRKGKELKIQKTDDGTLVYKDEASAFNPGFLLLEHQAGLRGNGNYISLTNLAVERDVAKGGNDLAAMPFKVTGISSYGSDGTNESYELMRYDGSERAAYDYTFDGNNGGAWTDQDLEGRDETKETEGFLIKNGNTAASITVRFYGKSEISNVAVYKEGGTDKSISLMKYNFNDSWTTDNPGTGNRFTHKENMSWNLFGSPYLCAMNYSDMEYGRVIYGYSESENAYNTINTANETSGYIPAGDAVFTQTATLKEKETVNIIASARKNGNPYAATSSLSVSIKRTGEASEDDAAYGDILQLDAVPASEARNEFDMSADGVKWMAGGEAQIYATRSGGRYSLLSAVSIDGKVAVGVTVPEPGMYTIAVPDDCLADGYESVVLEDALTGRSANLLEGGYDFTTVEEGDIIGRFNISFNRKADADGNIRAYFTADDMIRVEGVEPGDNISVYSVDGMRVASVTASSNVEDVRASVAVVAIVKAGGKTVKIRK